MPYLCRCVVERRRRCCRLRPAADYRSRHRCTEFRFGHCTAGLHGHTTRYCVLNPILGSRIHSCQVCMSSSRACRVSNRSFGRPNASTNRTRHAKGDKRVAAPGENLLEQGAVHRSSGSTLTERLLSISRATETSCTTHCRTLAERGAARRRCDRPHGPKERLRAAEGVVDTSAFALSKRLEGVRPGTAHGSAPAAGSW